jgi:hypothetical protein
MNDFLSLLRDALKSGQTIEVDAGNNALKIGSVVAPLDALTMYKSQKGTGPHYSVAQVWHLYRLRNLVHAKYVTEVGSAHGSAVSYVDRKDLLAYLLGEIATSKSIKPLPVAPASVLPTPATTTSTTTTTTTATTTTSATVDDDDSAAQMATDAVAPPTTKNGADAVAPSSPAAESNRAVRFADTVTAVSGDGALAAEAIAAADKAPTAVQKRSAKDRDASASASASAAKRVRSDAATAAALAAAEVDAVPDVPLDPAELEAIKATRAIETAERKLRNRKSVLRTTIKKKNNEPFFAAMIQQAKRLQKLDAVRRQLAEREQQSEKQRQRPTAYDRYDVREDQFWQERISDAKDLGLNTAGTFAGGLADDVSANNAAASAAKAAEARAAAQRRDAEKSRAAAAESASKATAEHESVPIIVVPDSVGPLTIVNAAKFLELGVYEPPTKLADARIAPVQRFKRGDAVVEVHSSSAASKLKDADWRERVCCVIAQGNVWQFRNWLFEEPVQLFSATRGVFFRFDDEKAPPTVLSWSVMQAVLSRSKPHLNKTCFMKFWQEIDRWAQRRPKLKMK